MHRLLCFEIKFPNHFAFTLGRYLFMLFYLSNLSNVDINYSYIYLLYHSCSMKTID